MEASSYRLLDAANSNTIDGFLQHGRRPSKKLARSWRVSGGLSALPHEQAQTTEAGKPKQKANLKQERPMQTKQSVINSNNHQPSTACREKRAAMRYGWAFLPLAAAILTLQFSTASSSCAGSATWKQSPASGEWFTVANWQPRTIPNGPGDTATFASSNQTSIDIVFDTEVNGIVFKPGASAFTIATNPQVTPELTISGLGVTNNSGIVQNFVVNPGGAQILFLN